VRFGSPAHFVERLVCPNVERGKAEVGTEISLRIAHEFDKSMEWLLTGEERL